MNLRIIACLAMAGPLLAAAQQPVPVGPKGSYASEPLLSHGRTDEHSGDQSVLMQSKKLWVTERPDQPIPTNDWWTGLINAPFADALWSYPAMVHPAASGVTVNYPSHWNDNGTELRWDSGLEIQADDFAASAAVADSWGDWHVSMLMADKGSGRSMYTTMAHGVPMTWIELRGGLSPKVVPSEQAIFFGLDGQDVADLDTYTDAALGIQVGDDLYGLYFPAATRPSLYGTTIYFDPAEYMVVALLPDKDSLAAWAEYALNLPVDTRLSWEYNDRSGEMVSHWKLTTRNLATGARGGEVVQGFLPHAYKGATRTPQFTATAYLTPRGQMKMAVGTEFTFGRHFAGMLPWWGAPQPDASMPNPYSEQSMRRLLETYAGGGTFGDDTYWGGKGLLQMAQCMAFARECGFDDIFAAARDKLKAKLIDWLTYTPGESKCYFAFYPHWGGLVGQESSFDSDTFNDHHFHYGYFTLAGAMLCLADEGFCRDYGPMLRDIAKDYANWDRTDTRFPFLRTMDPWVGHSYAGGLGDQANSNGNGQESSSEAMQGWGGVYLLGVALGDKEMRDAGIFGWTTEAMATREYWFDVDYRFDRYGQGGNYDHSLFTSPYNTNITCKGIGWWTWFSGNPVHLHGIQWLPATPALDYLSWDPEFVKWAYNDMMNTPGWTINWFEPGQNPDGNAEGRLADDDWGNVALTYMQRAMPDKAAEIFDRAIAGQTGIATAVSTGHISYYQIHSHRTYGDIDQSANADIPSAVRYVASGGKVTYLVYNPGEERDVAFYRDGEAERTFRAPARRLTTFSDAPQPESAEVKAIDGTEFLSTARFEARLLDQYGATVDGQAATWTVSPASAATITAEGVLTPAKATKRGTRLTVTATFADSGISASVQCTVDEPARLASGTIQPEVDFVERGTELALAFSGLDQYGRPFEGDVEWSVNGAVCDAPAIDTSRPGIVRIEARSGSFTATRQIFVTPALPDLARGCTATSSSEENAGTLTAHATDGDDTSRWGSAHRDGEWIYVDLGKDCRIARVSLNWEPAFASDYDIQVAPAGAPTERYTGTYASGTATLDVVAESAWQTAASITGVTSAGVHEHPVSATGRYVRIRAVKRATQYGVSLYTFGVHGFAADIAPTAPLGIDISAPAEFIDEGQSIQLEARTVCADGSILPAQVSWQASQGKITAGGVFTPATYGPATIKARTTEGLEGEMSLTVNEIIKASAIAAEPAKVTVATGESADIEISVLNQFGGLITNPDLLTASVAPDNDGLLLSADFSRIEGITPGEYTVTFAAGDIAAELPVKVVDIADMNLALGKNTAVSGKENDAMGGDKAVDGDLATRWGSAHRDGEWLAVDLGKLYLVNKIRIFVDDPAYATRALIEYSLDRREWMPLTERVRDGLGWEEFDVDGVELRHLRYSSLERSMIYGNSIHEFEVYGQASPNGVENVAVAAEPDTVDVVTATGIVLRKNVARAKAVEGLAPGLYIVGSSKVAVR